MYYNSEWDYTLVSIHASVKDATDALKEDEKEDKFQSTHL